MNPLYSQIMQGRGAVPNQNGMLTPAGQQFMQFANNFMNMYRGMNPGVFAQQLINSGQLTQDQLALLERCKKDANRLMGTNY